MTSDETAALAFLGFLVGLVVALVLLLGDQMPRRDVTTRTTGEPVPTEVE